MTGKNSTHCCPTWIYGTIFCQSLLKIFVSLSLSCKMLIRNWAPELGLSIAGFIQTLHDCKIWEDQIMSTFPQDLTSRDPELWLGLPQGCFWSLQDAKIAHNPWAFRPLFQAPCRHEICAQQCRSAKSHMLVFPSPVTWGKVTLPLSLPSSPCQGAVTWGRTWPWELSLLFLAISNFCLSNLTAGEVWTFKLLTLFREERKERGKERRGRKNESGVMPQ